MIDISMEKLLQLMADFGVMFILSGVVIFALCKGVGIGFRYLEERVGLKSHENLVDLRTQVSKTINQSIDQVLLQTHASRVYVFEFHNGASSLGGLPFLYMTNTYETLGADAKSEQHIGKNTPLSLHHAFVEELGKQPWLLMDTENRDTERFSTLIYETLAACGVSKTIRVKLTNSKKQMIGYLGVDYCVGSYTPNDAILDKYVDIVQYAATEIGALLSVQDK